jgi:hypothetical protein
MSTRRWYGGMTLLVGLTVLVFLAGCSAPIGNDSGVSSTPEMDGQSDSGVEETKTEERAQNDVDETTQDAEGTTQNDAEGSSTSEQTQDDEEPEESEDEGGEDSDTETTDGHQDGSSGPIDDSELPVDANRIYNQTAELLDSAAEPPTLNIKDIDMTVGMTENPFFEYLGLINNTESSDEGVGAAGYATGADTIVINDEYTSENLSSNLEQYLETTLAHEFVHTIQFEEGWLRPNWEEPPSVSRRSLEYTLLARSLIEGGAVDVTDEYAKATGKRIRQSQQMQRAYREATPDEKLSYAPYNLGGQYFDAVLDNASDLGSVYEENPPRSTTEILHPDRDDFELTPVEFTADAQADAWTRRTQLTDTTGEMFLHIMLSAHTDVETAEKAAAGWANDRLFGFGYEDDLSYAWALHWESAEDAAQFAAAFNETIDARDDAQASQLDVRFAGERSVVIVAGNQSFRDAVVVEGTNAELEIIVTPDENAVLRSEQTARSSGTPTPSPA